MLLAEQACRAPCPLPFSLPQPLCCASSSRPNAHMPRGCMAIPESSTPGSSWHCPITQSPSCFLANPCEEQALSVSVLHKIPAPNQSQRNQHGIKELSSLPGGHTKSGTELIQTVLEGVPSATSTQYVDTLCPEEDDRH